MANGVDANDAVTVGQLNSALAGVSGTDTTARTRADEAYARATSANDKADTNAANILFNMTNIAGLTDRMGTAESAITALQNGNSQNAADLTQAKNDIAANTSAIGGLTTRMGGAETSLASNTAKIAEIDARSNSVAIGGGSSAASAGGTQGTALGSTAAASGEESTSLGAATEAAGLRSTAVGRGAFADGVQTSAIGTGSRATGVGSSAIGGFSAASGNFSTALGYASSTVAAQAVAVGYQAQARDENATAIGTQARAEYAKSTAIGYAAVTTAANQVVLGGAGSSVVIGDLDASTAAQEGPVDVVTVDANGVLGKQQAATAASVAAVRADVGYIAAVTDAQFAALSADVTALGGRVDALGFRLDEVEKLSKGGIAAAMAQVDAPMPSEPGRTSYGIKGSVFRGQGAVSLGLAHRLDTESPFAISASVSHAGGDNTGATVGIVGEF